MCGWVVNQVAVSAGWLACFTCLHVCVFGNRGCLVFFLGLRETLPPKERHAYSFLVFYARKAHRIWSEHLRRMSAVAQVLTLTQDRLRSQRLHRLCLRVCPLFVVLFRDTKGKATPFGGSLGSPFAFGKGSVPFHIFCGVGNENKRSTGLVGSILALMASRLGSLVVLAEVGVWFADQFAGSLAVLTHANQLAFREL